MHRLKLRKFGNSVGAILGKDVLAKLHAAEGDELYLVETPEGMMITAYDPEFEAQMTAAEGVMGRYRNALKQLAK